jgi:hypothetical protein
MYFPTTPAGIPVFGCVVAGGALGVTAGGHISDREEIAIHQNDYQSMGIGEHSLGVLSCWIIYEQNNDVA